MGPNRRVELESVLKCPHCAATPYRVFRRQLVQADGTPLVSWGSVLWPARPAVPPPRAPARLGCPDCGDPLVRVAP